MVKIAPLALYAGTSAHSFSTLMVELAAIVRNTCPTPRVQP